MLHRCRAADGSPREALRAVVLRAGDEVLLGRHPDCAISILSRRIAPRQARFTAVDDAVLLENLVPHYGDLHLDGARVDQRDARVIGHRALITLGEWSVRLVDLRSGDGDHDDRWLVAHDEVRRRDLEAMARAQPHDESPLDVYADWLQSEGSPLGALVALQLDARRRGDAIDETALLQQQDALWATHRKRLLGALSHYVTPAQYELHHQNGFAQRLRVDDVAVEHVEHFLARPIAALLRELQAERVANHDGEALLAALLHHGQAEGLTTLALVPGAGCRDLLDALCAGRWPALRQLSLRYGNGVAALSTEALAPLLEPRAAESMPALRELELTLPLQQPAALGEIFSAPLIRKLARLRLVMLHVNDMPHSHNVIPWPGMPAAFDLWLSLDVVLEALEPDYREHARIERENIAGGTLDEALEDRLRESNWPALDVLAREDFATFVDVLAARGDLLFARALGGHERGWSAPPQTVHDVRLDAGLIRLSGMLDGGESW